MIKPIPNVLYNKENEAEKRLYEFKVVKKYVETNKSLPGYVFDYERYKKEDTVILKIAKAPKNSFSLDENIEYVDKKISSKGPVIRLFRKNSSRI